MADVPAVRGDSDLLEMELGLAIKEDEFKKAEQEMDKLKDKFNDMSSKQSIDIKAPSLDKTIKSIERLIALISKLNSIGIDISMNQLGGLQHGLTPMQNVQLALLEGTYFDTKFGLNKESILPAIEGIQKASAEIYSEGVTPDNKKFMDVVAMANKLKARGVKGAEKYASASQLEKLFIDKNMNPLEILGDFYSLALQGLQVAENDPEMANLVKSFMSNFLTTQLK